MHDHLPTRRQLYIIVMTFGLLFMVSAPVDTHAPLSLLLGFLYIIVAVRGFRVQHI